MNLQKTVLFLFFLFSIGFSVSEMAHFEATPSFPEYQFYTDVSVDTEFSCGADDDSILDQSPRESSDICDVFTTVCPGTRVTVTPSVSGSWGSNAARGREFEIVSAYPRCGGGSDICRVPNRFSGSMRSYSVDWLDESLFDDYAVDSGGYARVLFTSNEGEYDDLNPPFHRVPVEFIQQDPVTFEPVSHLNSLGYGDVFCKGDVTVYHNGRSVDSFEAGSGDSVSVTLDSEGEHSIRTELRNVECFAALVKDPVDYGIPGWFVIYYFGYDGPSFDNDRFERVITVDSRACSVEYDESETIPYLEEGESAETTVTITNDGEIPATVEIMGTSHGYRVTEFEEDICIDLFGSEFCFTQSGFETPIDPGRSRDLHISVLRTARVAAECPEVWLNYECSGSCGSGSGTISFPLECEGDIEPPPVDTLPYCEIDPDEADLGQGEIHRFDVTCYDADGLEIPCTGTSWSFGGGIDAHFYRPPTERDALVRSYSPIGTTGTLEYDCGPVCAPCEANLTVTAASLICEVDPSEANLEVDESQQFDLICTHDGRSITPDDVDWWLEDISGTLSDRGVDGAKFVGDRPDEGEIVALADFGHIWVEDDAHITVGDGFPGDVILECEIDPPSAMLYVGDSEDFTVYCYLDGDLVDLTSVDWSLDEGDIGDITTDGDTVTFTGTAVGNDDLVAEVNYRGIPAEVSAPITVLSEDAMVECEIVPPEATLYVGEFENFKLNCTLAGERVTPTAAEWHLSGITGFLEEYGVEGAVFTGTEEGDGNLIAKVDYEGTTYLPYAILHVLNDSDENETDENETDDDDDDDDDDTRWCVVRPAYINDSTNTVHKLLVRCGPPEDRRPCTVDDDVGWGTNDRTVVDFFSIDEPFDYIFKRIQLIGDVGDMAEVFAYVDDDESHRCTADVEINPQVCLEYT